MGFFSALRASNPGTEPEDLPWLGEAWHAAHFIPLDGAKRVPLRPPAHQARASGLNHPHVVRLADPDYHRCAVFVRPSAHNPRFPRLLTSRCEISSRRRYAAATELRALGRTSTASHPALARLGHLAIAGVVGLFEPDACGP